MRKFRDLGLSYIEAVQAMQSGVAYEQTLPERASATNAKHLRVGVNAAMVTDSAIAMLLIEKGIFSMDEYAESVRLAMNEEVARYEETYKHLNVKFR